MMSPNVAANLKRHNVNKWPSLNSATFKVLSQSQINSFTGFGRFLPACTPFSWELESRYDTKHLEKKHAYFLHLLTGGVRPLIRSVSLTRLPGDGISALNYYWLQHLPMQMWRPQWLSSAFGDPLREGVERTPQMLVGWQERGFTVQTALISSYGGLNVRAVLTRTAEIEERDIHERKCPRTSSLKLVIFIIAPNPCWAFLSACLGVYDETVLVSGWCDCCWCPYWKAKLLSKCCW